METKDYSTKTYNSLEERDEALYKEYLERMKDYEDLEKGINSEIVKMDDGATEIVADNSIPESRVRKILDYYGSSSDCFIWFLDNDFVGIAADGRPAYIYEGLVSSYQEYYKMSQEEAIIAVNDLVENLTEHDPVVIYLVENPEEE